MTTWRGSTPSHPLRAKLSGDHRFFQIIEEAYDVFSYPKPDSIEVCQSCCMNGMIEADFFNPPIRQLPLEYVQEWYLGAYAPQGVAKATWAYLLPRLLEILASGETVAHVGLEVSLSRFDTGNLKNWSTNEWDVLDRFQRLFLQHRLEDTTDFLDDVVCMFRLAGWSLDDLKAQLESTSSQTLALRLWNDWCAWPLPGSEGIWVSAFWQSPEDRDILDFYTSDRLYEKMASLALDDDTQPDLAAKALDVVCVMRP